MHSTGSFLLTVIERVRAYIDEATLDAKYTNDYLVRHVIGPEMVNVISRLSNNYGNPIRVRHSIAINKTTEHYVLPPQIGEVYRVAISDSDNRVTQEFMPENEFNSRGPNWQIQGNMLSFRPLPTSDQTVDIHYIPNGDFQPHYSSSGGGLDSTKKIFTLATTPTLGDRDPRENAYAGATLRVWNDAGLLEERVIDSYNATSRQATVRVAFSTSASDSSLRYEIAPVGMNSMYQAIACSCAINLGTARNITQKQMQFILTQYKMAMKSVGDNLSNIQARKGKMFAKRTVDNSAQIFLGD